MRGSGPGRRRVIRAHMASYPPRQAVMLATLARLAPQVDRVDLCLNEYDAVPAVLARFPNVHPVIPDRDLKDTGKFVVTAAPDDVVFLADDDIGYPPGYVAETLAKTRAFGTEGNVFSYLGSALQYNPSTRRPVTRNYLFGQTVSEATGVDIVGTGVACALGRHLPPLEYMAGAQRMADVRFSRWLFEQGLRGWLLPRARFYLTTDLPDDLAGTSLYETFTRHRPPQLQAELRQVLGRAPHVTRLVAEDDTKGGT